MKVYVCVSKNWFAIPCTDDTKKINWLAQEAGKRYGDLTGKTKDSNRIYSADGLIAFDGEDVISQTLEDLQFLVLGDETITDRPEIPKHNAEEKTIVEKPYVTLDGESLTTDVLYSLSTGSYSIRISDEAMQRIEASRKILEDITKSGKVVYGVSTGFGNFARTVIDSECLDQLQKNLIESHCAGVGDPLPPSRVRMLLALRINVLCKGYSGISTRNLKVLVTAFNASCLSYVPEKGTLGASGDLAPLAHLALGLMGKGQMWSPESGWSDASHVMEAHKIELLNLKAKEGLALINGCQFIASLGSEAVERAKAIARQADIVAALTVEVLSGTAKAFDADIHVARPHKGQNEVARRLRTLLKYGIKPSEITVSHKACTRVQDSYTLRCCPQVHGIAHDTIQFVNDVLNTELNSATDNPMVLIERKETISGGNFHGEYPAKVLDFLAIAIHEISAISERRIERLCNPSLSDLPAFLVKNGGLNSGFMIAHCTAASLVSENKCLCHPSSVDSLSTSAAQEDHVSMGGWAARKALRVVEHVEQVVAIELLCACQALDFHRPLTSTPPLEEVYKTVRQIIPFYDKDRVMYKDIESATQLLRDEMIWASVASYLQ